MTKFKFLHAVAIPSIMIVTLARANRIEGREVAARPWSAACMTDHGPSLCAELICVYSAGGGHKKMHCRLRRIGTARIKRTMVGRPI